MNDHDEKYRLLIGARIKSLRHLKQWTAEEAGKQAGISRSRWLNWECGTRAPRIYMFPLLANVLGTSASYLAGFTNSPGEQPDNWGYVTANNPKIETIKGLNNCKQIVSDSIAFRATDLENKGIKGNEIVLLKVPDDSMRPDFSKGDEVLIDMSDRYVKEPDIYAIRESDDSIWLRWIRKDIGGAYTLYANNKTHSNDQQLTADQFRELDIVGRYVWSGSWRK